MLLTKSEARNFLLAHQSLLPPRRLKGKPGILTYIQRVGSIQYDPLNMVGYNPYLVLQSRVKNFNPDDLEELLYNERRLLDGWDKNMSIYPVEDWPYFSRYREDAYQYYGGESRPILKILSEVREVIAEKGPVSSGDLEFDHKVRWAWGPTRAARAALESMYFWGELIVHHKEGTRKIYDFADKYLLPEILSQTDPNATLEEFFAWMVKRRVGAIGLLWERAGDAWLGTKWMKSKERNQAFYSLLDKGEIIQVEVQDCKYPFYIRKEEESLLKEILQGVKVASEAAFLAPLDNLLWDRKLITEIFDFEYVWEVYKPVKELKYGYYVLPVLYRNSFVARFEPRFNRDTQELEILNWWWEPRVTVSKALAKALHRSIEYFMRYLGASSITFSDAIDPELITILT